MKRRSRFGWYFGLALILGIAGLIVLAVLLQQSPAPAEVVEAQKQPATAPSLDGPTSDAVPVSVRGGLPHVATKLDAGKPITVVFLGGSATASGGGRSFAEQIGYWLRAKYTGARVKVINSGIVQTNSGFGAARVDRDVLSQSPDLVVVEFATDSMSATRQTAEDMLLSYERIVRKVWTADPTIDFLFLYPATEARLNLWMQQRLPPAMTIADRVAKNYEIPSVAIGLAVVNAMKKGVDWHELFVDELAPTPKGHSVYASMITEALPNLLSGTTNTSRDLEKLKTLSPSFWLYLPSKTPTPQDEPPAMKLVDGSIASRTWDLPVVGTHWMHDAESRNPDAPKGADGKQPVLWRLRTQSMRENGRRLNEVFSLDRTKWGPMMTWFDEYRCFTGPAGLPLIETSDKKRVHIEVRGDDLPIVSFIAPESGRYVFSVVAANTFWWGGNDAIAMNVVHFRESEPRGESVGLHRSEEGLLREPNIAGEVRLEKGDELAFCVDSNNALPGGGASYLNTLITIGLFDATKSEQR